MITTLTVTVTLPAWLFLLILFGLLAFNVYVMWANETQRKDNRRLRRRLNPPARTAPEDGRIPLGELTGGGDL
jgi:hypothetical protein